MLQHSDCTAKARWASGAVWLTTKHGFNLNCETAMTNETQCMAIILKIYIYI